MSDQRNIWVVFYWGWEAGDEEPYAAYMSESEADAEAERCGPGYRVFGPFPLRAEDQERRNDD